MKRFADVTRRLRHPYVLVAVVAAGVVLALLLPGARSHGGPSGAQTLTIAGQGPRACVAPLVDASRHVSVVVRRRATVVRTLQVSATRSAVAAGARGLARASATAVDRVHVSQTASASSRVSVLVRVGARVHACARATSATAAQALALTLARRAGRARARLALAARVASSAQVTAEQRAGPGVLHSARLTAVRGLTVRLAAAQRRALAVATDQAQRDAAARAGRAAA